MTAKLPDRPTKERPPVFAIVMWLTLLGGVAWQRSHYEGELRALRNMNNALAADLGERANEINIGFHVDSLRLRSSGDSQPWALRDADLAYAWSPSCHWCDLLDSTMRAIPQELRVAWINRDPSAAGAERDHAPSASWAVDDSTSVVRIGGVPALYSVHDGRITGVARGVEAIALTLRVRGLIDMEAERSLMQSFELLVDSLRAAS